MDYAILRNIYRRDLHFQLSVVILVFASLIGDSAACFASGLARSLAFAAAAFFCAFAKIAGFNSFNMFHFNLPPYLIFRAIVSYIAGLVNYRHGFSHPVRNKNIKLFSFCYRILFGCMVL